MTNIKLKVCGMRDPDNIRDVLRLNPDFMGFIFYRGTPRFVGDKFAMPEKISDVTKTVGVFVNEVTDVIVEYVKKYRLDYVQLHGGESVDECKALADCGVRVIKVFSIDDQMDFESTKDFNATVDYLLFDTKGQFYGGNARRFDWKVLSRYDQEIPFFLSGGITPEHVDEIKTLKDLNLVAIDVNSGVEIRPAYKDIDKIKAIRASLI